MASKWTPERREKARQQCLERQPWLKSTGPRTPEGKARSSLNSLKHGLRCKNTIVQVLGKWLLREQAEEQARAELATWLPEAVALKKKNPELHAALEEILRIDEQTPNEVAETN